VLGDIIRNRKENVVKILQELESRVRESEEILTLAKENLETTKSKAEEIREQGESLSIQTSKSILCATEDDIKRIKSINLLTLKMQEKKSLSEVCQKLNSLSFKKARELLKKRLNSKFHKKLISRKIEKLSSLSKKKQKKNK
jgi:F0F1-type ATP synthase membrane subunit b/b'